MAELNVNKREQLQDQPLPFDDRNNYQKALRFADGKLKEELSGIITFINDRNETARKDGIYQQALAAMERGEEADYKEAARLFETIKEYRDATAKIPECLESAEIARKKAVYRSALSLMAENDEQSYRYAATLFRSIPGFEDADDCVQECLSKEKTARKDKVYNACKQVLIDPLRGGSWYAESFFSSIEGFNTLGDYRDSRDLAEACRKKLYQGLCERIDTNKELPVTKGYFERLGNYRDSAEKAQQCQYKINAIANDGIYEDALKATNDEASVENLEYAIQCFQTIPGWRDADEQIEICRRRIEHIAAQKEAERRTKLKKRKQKKAVTILFVILAMLAVAAFLFWNNVIKPQQTYNRALELYNAGQYENAIKPFSELNGYKDSYQLRKECWNHVVANRNTIAVGAYHTIGLKTDGTVVAFGSDYHGQCNVSSWTGIVSVAAGYDYSVGLKADGTVVATEFTGNREYYYGQCNVSDWTSIMAVEAGWYHTVGLKTDGTVVATKYTGNNDYGQCDVSGWTDIVSIAAGLKHTIGLKANGTVVATEYRKNQGDYYGQCDVSDWTDIVAIAAGENHTVGLKANGSVVAVGLNYYGRCDVSSWSDIIAIAAGTDFTVGLKADGTVVATKYTGKQQNYRGQCDVSDWKNIVAIATGYHYTVGLEADGSVVATDSSTMIDWESTKLDTNNRREALNGSY